MLVKDDFLSYIVVFILINKKILLLKSVLK